jgi:hypothetical protein
MTRKIFADECGRRALGVVRVAPLQPVIAAQSVGAKRVESTSWAFAWVGSNR